jgi:hypothetical protein
MGADPVEHIAEIFKGINLTQLTAGHEAVDNCGPLGTDVASGEKPILTTNGDNTKNPLGQVVVDGKVTILNVLIQRYPLSTGITYCLAYLG